jgi:hypothetical protein
MQRRRENMKNSAANELRDRRLKSGYRLPFGEIGGNAGLAGLAATPESFPRMVNRPAQENTLPEDLPAKPGADVS